MGQSGGRTRGAPQRPEARRRLSEDERAQVHALHDDPEAWPDLHDEEERYRSQMIAWCSARWLGLLTVTLGAIGTVNGSSWWLVLAGAGAAIHVMLDLCQPKPPRITRWPRRPRH